jgi:hypothetical protein
MDATRSFALALRIKQSAANGLPSSKGRGCSARSLPYFKYRTFAAAWTLEATADLQWIDVELGDGAAERVAVHTQRLRGFTLVSFVMRQYLNEKALFELAHGFVVGNSTGVHLGHKVIQLAFHLIPLS